MFFLGDFVLVVIEKCIIACVLDTWMYIPGRKIYLYPVNALNYVCTCMPVSVAFGIHANIHVELLTKRE